MGRGRGDRVGPNRDLLGQSPYLGPPHNTQKGELMTAVKLEDARRVTHKRRTDAPRSRGLREDFRINERSKGVARIVWQDGIQ